MEDILITITAALTFCCGLQNDGYNEWLHDDTLRVSNYITRTEHTFDECRTQCPVDADGLVDLSNPSTVSKKAPPGQVRVWGYVKHGNLYNCTSAMLVHGMLLFKTTASVDCTEPWHCHCVKADPPTTVTPLTITKTPSTITTTPSTITTTPSTITTTPSTITTTPSTITTTPSTITTMPSTITTTPLTITTAPLAITTTPLTITTTPLTITTTPLTTTPSTITATPVTITTTPLTTTTTPFTITTTPLTITITPLAITTTPSTTTTIPRILTTNKPTSQTSLTLTTTLRTTKIPIISTTLTKTPPPIKSFVATPQTSKTLTKTQSTLIKTLFNFARTTTRLTTTPTTPRTTTTLTKTPQTATPFKKTRQTLMTPATTPQTSTILTMPPTTTTRQVQLGSGQSRTTDQKIPFNSNATAYKMYSNLSVSVNGTLYCPCNVSYAPAAPNSTAIEHQSFNEMIAEMTFDPKTLSKNTRRYRSAPDGRTSSVIIGTFAMAVILSVVSFIVLLDSSRLVTWTAKMTSNCRKLKTQLPGRSLASIEQSTKPHCNDFRDDPLSQSPVRDHTEVQERPGRPPLLRHHYRRWSKHRLASVVQSPDNVTLSEINQ